MIRYYSQNWILYPVLCLYALTLHANAETKIDNNLAKEITNFTLYNYDNIVADYYEQNKPYLSQLSHLLANATNNKIKNIESLKLSDSLVSEPNAVIFMLNLNKHIKKITGYYFVND